MSQEIDGCVKFSKNSWHRRLVNCVFPYFVGYRANGEPKVNLCPYMRRVVFSIFLIPFVLPWRKLPYQIQDQAWLLHAELIFLGCIMAGAFLFDYADTYQGNDVFPDYWTLVAIGFFAGNLIGVVGGASIAGGFALKDRLKKRPKKEHRTRGLLKEYIASKHNKICPCVEFVED